MSTATGQAGAVLPFASGRDRRPLVWPGIVVAAAIFGLAYANGGYGIEARTTTAIGLWVLVVAAVGFGLVPRERLSRAGLTAASLLGALCVWTLASAFWAPSAERAFEEFDRTALYLAVFLVALGTSRARDLAWWTGGLLVAIAAVVAVALVSRLVPGSFGSRGLAPFIPNASTRLSFPVGYWNGLAILAALALPLALGSATAVRSRALRAALVGGTPLVAAVVVLASSRGGVLAAISGVVVLVAGSGRRWEVLRLTAVTLLGSAAAVATLHVRSVLVDGPLGTSAAARAGHITAVLLVLVVAATGAAQLLSDRLATGRRRPSAPVGRIALVVVVVAAVAAVVAAHPVRRFDEFRRVPASAAAGNFATAHLVSGNGSGRWQFWTAAVHEWESAPLVGRGAASYQGWWSAHASFTYSLRNAHSLYLETLGDLGLVGALLLLGFVLTGFAGARTALRETDGADRERVAALTAVAAAFFATAAIEWTWQLTAVAAVGVAALGVAAGRSAVRTEPGAERTTWARLGVAAVGLALAWGIVVGEAIPWLASARVADSRGAENRRDVAAARTAALDARALEPWAATPYLQLALVAEAAHDYATAARYARGATKRNLDDWSVWLVRSRIEQEAGDPHAASAAYARARSLNPRSPVFGRD